MARSFTVSLLSGLLYAAFALAQEVTVPASAKEGGPRRWEVVVPQISARAAPSEAAAVVVALDQGAIVTNMGCAESEAEVWCEVRPFRGGPRGFLPAEALVPAKGPDGSVPMGADDSARRVGKGDFDAEAQIACAQEQGQALGTCTAAVARGTGGDATVRVIFPNGFARRLHFRQGEFVSASATMSGAGRDIDWALRDGLHLIRADDQRYEIPDAFLFGG